MSLEQKKKFLEDYDLVNREDSYVKTHKHHQLDEPGEKGKALVFFNEILYQKFYFSKDLHELHTNLDFNQNRTHLGNKKYSLSQNNRYSSLGRTTFFDQNLRLQQDRLDRLPKIAPNNKNSNDFTQFSQLLYQSLNHQLVNSPSKQNTAAHSYEFPQITPELGKDSEDQAIHHLSGNNYNHLISAQNSVQQVKQVSPSRYRLNQLNQKQQTHIQELINNDGKLINTVLLYGGDAPIHTLKQFQEIQETRENKQKVESFIERNYKNPLGTFRAMLKDQDITREMMEQYMKNNKKYSQSPGPLPTINRNLYIHKQYNQNPNRDSKNKFSGNNSHIHSKKYNQNNNSFYDPKRKLKRDHLSPDQRNDGNLSHRSHEQDQEQDDDNVSFYSDISTFNQKINQNKDSNTNSKNKDKNSNDGPHNSQVHHASKSLDDEYFNKNHQNKNQHAQNTQFEEPTHKMKQIETLQDQFQRINSISTSKTSNYTPRTSKQQNSDDNLSKLQKGGKINKRPLMNSAQNEIFEEDQQEMKKNSIDSIQNDTFNNVNSQTNQTENSQSEQNGSNNLPVGDKQLTVPLSDLVEAQKNIDAAQEKDKDSPKHPQIETEEQIDYVIEKEQKETLIQVQSPQIQPEPSPTKTDSIIKKSQSIIETTDPSFQIEIHPPNTPSNPTEPTQQATQKPKDFTVATQNFIHNLCQELLLQQQKYREEQIQGTQEPDDDINTYLMGMKESLDNQKLMHQMDAALQHVETQIVWKFDQLTNHIQSQIKFEPQMFQVVFMPQQLPKDIFELDQRVEFKQQTSFYWMGNHIAYQLPQCYFSKIQFQQNPLSVIRVHTPSQFGLSPQILIFNSIYYGQEKFEQLYKNRLQNIHINNLLLGHYDHEPNLNPSVPFDLVVFQNQNELVLLHQFEDFIQLDEIIDNNVEKSLKLDEFELIYIFKSCLESLSAIHSMNISHNQINLTSICYMPSQKLFKFYQFDQCCMFDNRGVINKFQYFNNEDYAPPERKKGVDLQAANIIAFQLYALGICFLALKNGIRENEISRRNIENCIPALKQEKCMSNKIILALLEDDPIKRVSLSIQEWIRQINEFNDFSKDPFLNHAQFNPVALNRVDISNKNFVNLLKNKENEEMNQLMFQKLIQEATDMGILYQKTFQWQQAAQTYDTIIQTSKQMKMENQTYRFAMGYIWVALFYQNLIGECLQRNHEFFKAIYETNDIPLADQLYFHKVSGDAQFQSSRYKEALQDYGEALKILKHEETMQTQECAKILYQMGKSYKMSQDFINYKFYVQKTRELLIEDFQYRQTYQMYLQTLNKLKEIYQIEGKFEKSLENMQDLYNLMMELKENPLDDELIQIMIEGAEMAQKFEQYEQARKCYYTIIQNYQKNMENKEFQNDIIIQYQENLYQVYELEQKYQDCVDILQKSLQIMRDVKRFDNTYFQIQKRIGDLYYFKLDDKIKGKFAYEKVMEICQKLQQEHHPIVKECKYQVMEIQRELRTQKQ